MAIFAAASCVRTKSFKTNCFLMFSHFMPSIFFAAITCLRLVLSGKAFVASTGLKDTVEVPMNKNPTRKNWLQALEYPDGVDKDWGAADFRFVVPQ